MIIKKIKDLTYQAIIQGRDVQLYVSKVNTVNFIINVSHHFQSNKSLILRENHKN